MRYEIQWYPKGTRTKYNINKLLRAVASQEGVRDVAKAPTINNNSWKQPTLPEAVQFTVTGSYPYEIIMGVNESLMMATKSSEPQGLSVRAVSTVERKKITKPVKTKRNPCGCKK